MTIDKAIGELEKLREKHGGNLEVRHFSGEAVYPESQTRIDVYYEKPGKQGKVECACFCSAQRNPSAAPRHH